MAQKRNLLRSIGLSLLALAPLSPAAQNPFEWTGVEKIIAVGDLHGDYENFLLILKNPKVALVDDGLHWTGGKTHLVQTGDIMDRGKDARKILDLLMRLEKEAEAAGGKVHVLLGNHEEATITGISLGYPDYVSPQQFVSFLSETYRKGREKQFISRLPAAEQAQVRALGNDLDKNPSLFNFWAGILDRIRKREEPLAALAYIENFNWEYGRWLRKKNCVIKINDIVFVHGGFNLEFSSWKLKELNEFFRIELSAYALNPTSPRLGGEPFTPRLIYNPQGPLWYRQDEVTSQEEIEKILANLGAARMVVGHNFLGSGGGSPIVLSEDTVARFEEKVWMIDTGIGYSDLGGILYALIIKDGNYDFFRASAVPATPAAGESPTGDGPQTPAEIKQFLKESTPLVVVPGAAGRTDPWRVKLASNGITRWAQFKYINRPRPAAIPDSFNYELAAYELNVLLGLDFVPPAVPRTVKDTLGSLQIFVEDVIRESDRKRENIRPPDPEAFDRERADLRVFENLVYDACENDKDTLVEKETGKLYRVDFSEAFAPENVMIPGCEIRRCSRKLFQSLADWDDANVIALLGSYLNEEELRALSARRAAIVRVIQEQIEERGEKDVLFD